MAEKLNRTSLTNARKARKLSVHEVSSFTKISEDSLAKIERGDKQPTFRQLEQLSDLYNIKLHTLFLDKQPDIEATLPDFRKAIPSDANLSPKGLSRLWQVERRSIFTNEVLSALGNSAPATLSLQRITNKNAPEPTEFRAAFDSWRESVEKTIKLSGSREDLFGKYLRIFLETRSCQTIINSAPMEDYLGFYASVSDKARTIFVNRDIRNDKRKLFTLSHELGHLLLDIEGISNPFIAKNSVEKQCNSFAACFLATDYQIFQIVDNTPLSILQDVQRLVNLVSRETLLSRQASVLRLEELDVITPRQKTEAFRYLGSLSRLVEPPSEDNVKKPMGRGVAVGKKLSEVGILAAYAAQLALSRNLIDTVDVERGLGISENLQKDVLDLAARRFEAGAR